MEPNRGKPTKKWNFMRKISRGNGAVHRKNFQKQNKLPDALAPYIQWKNFQKKWEKKNRWENKK